MSDSPITHQIIVPAILVIRVREDGSIADLTPTIAWGGLYTGPGSVAATGALVETPDGDPIGAGADHPDVIAASQAPWGGVPVSWESL